MELLRRKFIIDGQQMAVTPYRMLQDCTREGFPEGESDAEEGQAVDETLDLFPSNYKFDSAKIGDYLALTAARAGFRRSVPPVFAASFTAGRVARALIDTLWMSGRFTLEDLSLRAEWKWDSRPVGHLAALYHSIESATSYIDALGIFLKDYAFSDTPGERCTVAFRAVDAEESKPRLGKKRLCPAALQDSPGDKLVYIPFDPCDFRLGGSVLSEETDARSSLAPEINDADYFIDCYEVVRELVEDGIVKAGATVSDGGLLTALKGMCRDGLGAAVDITAIRDAYGELPVRILFAEVPGVILQVADADFDYVDAELLLQDIAYFPLGGPVRDADGHISVNYDAKSGVAGILQSLLSGQASEGED